MLRHQHGVDPKSIGWVTGGLEKPSRKPLIALNYPGIDVRHQETKTLNDMLIAGEID